MKIFFSSVLLFTLTSIFSQRVSAQAYFVYNASLDVTVNHSSGELDALASASNWSYNGNTPPTPSAGSPKKWMAYLGVSVAYGSPDLSDLSIQQQIFDAVRAAAAWSPPYYVNGQASLAVSVSENNGVPSSGTVTITIYLKGS